MLTYVRITRSVRYDELAPHVRDKLTDHAESRQIDARMVRSLWVTHSENPSADSGLGKLFRRRVNPSDPDAEHDTVVALHPTHVLIAVDGAKRGTSVLSVPLIDASVVRGAGIGSAPGQSVDDGGGFTITGFVGDHRPGSLYVGLGTEAAATECFTAVEQAIMSAKNPGR